MAGKHLTRLIITLQDIAAAQAFSGQEAGLEHLKILAACCDNKDFPCTGKPLLCGWEVYSAGYHRHPLCVLLQQVRH